MSDQIATDVVAVADADAVAELLRATTTIGEHYYAAAGALGLTVQEARLLFVLASEPTNMLGLTSALRVPKSTMTGLMARMEADGLITRERDPGDRRALIATPTSIGRDVAARFARDLADRVSGVLSPLDPSEGRQLAAIVSDMLVRLEPTSYWALELDQKVMRAGLAGLENWVVRL